MFGYPQRTLDDEITEPRLQGRKFEETELWSILASCILGLSHLQKNGIKHSAIKSTSILLSADGIIKVSDPFATAQPPIYDVALLKRSSPHLYLAPELCISLNKEYINPKVDDHRADVWSLGMVILEAGLLEYQD